MKGCGAVVGVVTLQCTKCSDRALQYWCIYVVAWVTVWASGV